MNNVKRAGFGKLPTREVTQEVADVTAVDIKRLSIDLPETMHDELRLLAFKRKTTMKKLVVKMIDDLIRANKQAM